LNEAFPREAEAFKIAPIVVESPQLSRWHFEAQQARTCNGKRDRSIHEFYYSASKKKFKKM